MTPHNDTKEKRKQWSKDVTLTLLQAAQYGRDTGGLTTEQVTELINDISRAAQEAIE